MAKKMISFEGTDELKEVLRVAAFQQNKTVSALIRDTLEATFTSSKKSEVKIGVNITNDGQEQ